MILKDWVFKDFFWEKRVGGGKKNVASYKLFNAFMEQYESSFLPGVPLYILCLGKQHQRNRAPECSTFSTSQRAFLRMLVSERFPLKTSQIPSVLD